MSKDSSAKYYQNTKERLQKKTRERCQSLSKEKKQKCNNMVVNDTKTYLNRKKKSLLSIEKNVTK